MIIKRLPAWLLMVAMFCDGLYIHAREVQMFTLEQLFELAESNNIVLQTSRLGEIETEQNIKVARSAFLPEINTSLSVSYIGDGFIVDRNFSNYVKAPIPHLGNSLSVTVDQPVYTGGALTSQTNLAKLRSEASLISTSLSRDNIRMQITDWYLDIYKYENTKLVITKNIERARIILDNIIERYNQGVALHNDITRYELLISNLELQLVKIDNLLEIINQSLLMATGLPDDTRISTDTTILARSLPCDGEEWWMSQALTCSPSMRLADSDINICRENESLVKSDSRPKIGFRAAWNFDGPILVEVPPINKNLSYWYIGASVSYNLSALYKTDKVLSRARAATFKAVSSREMTRQKIKLMINAGYLHYMEAYEEFKTRQISVKLANDNYDVISTRYGEGMALITDMLDAANSTLDAERQLVNSRINILQQYYNLLFISGKI